jgi:hypothetical protein
VNKILEILPGAKANRRGGIAGELLVTLALCGAILLGAVLLGATLSGCRGADGRDAPTPEANAQSRPDAGGASCNQEVGDNNSGSVTFGDQTCEGGRGDQNTGDQSESEDEELCGSCSAEDCDTCAHDPSGECCECCG